MYFEHPPPFFLRGEQVHLWGGLVGGGGGWVVGTVGVVGCELYFQFSPFSPAVGLDLWVTGGQLRPTNT